MFEIDGVVGDASLIAHGFLDEHGNLAASEVFKGTLPAQPITVATGGNIYQGLLAGMKESSGNSSNTVEVVAFLGAQQKDGWQPCWGSAAVAGLAGTNVFLAGAGGGKIFNDWNIPVGLDQHFNRESFFAAIREEVRLDEQLDALCALPHTAGNVQEILAFLMKHKGWHHQRRVQESLRPIASWQEPINADVQAEVLKEIADTVDVTNKWVLLKLSANLHLSGEAFDPIASLIGTNQPPEVRRAAMWTLYRIDQSRTTARLLPGINLAEPELYTALPLLQSEDSATDLKIAEVLLSLSHELRQQAIKSPGPDSFNDEEALRQQLVRHVNPDLMTFYFDWLLQDQPASAAFVCQDLQAMLGVRWNADQLKTWWELNRKRIQTTFSLQSDAGRQQWFSAYQDGDEAAKHFLVRLWMLTPATNQVALVKMAMEKKTAKAATAVITELWNAKHLGNEAIQAMFENFMKVDFVDLDKDRKNRFKSQHRLQVNLTFNYPFNTCIYYRVPIAVDGNLLPYTGSLSQLCPDPQTKEYQIGAVGGYLPGQVATGTLEVYQREHYPDGKELWHAQWDLGSIPLGE